jgi:hypothetical protein
MNNALKDSFTNYKIIGIIKSFTNYLVQAIMKDLFI